MTQPQQPTQNQSDLGFVVAAGLWQAQTQADAANMVALVLLLDLPTARKLVTILWPVTPARPRPWRKTPLSLAGRVQAEYLINAVTRLKTAAETGELPQALAREQLYAVQHRRAQIRRASAMTQVRKARRQYGTLLGWHATVDAKTTPACRIASGKNFPVTTGPFPGLLHGGTCFPAGTKVVSPRVLGSTVRWADGELVEITTGGGNFLSVTPNHPVLTPDGWVAAGLLDEGGYVVSTRLAEQTVGLVDPHEDHVPALIEDVAGSFGEDTGVVPVPVPVAAEDFHGDGADSEVAVIRADGMLVDHVISTQSQPSGVEQFPGMGRDSSMPRAGAQLLRFPAGLAPLGGGDAIGGPFDASDGIMGGLGIAPVLLGTAVGHHEPVGVGDSTAGDAVFSEYLRDSVARDAVFSREPVFAGTGAVGSDDFVGGQRRYDGYSERSTILNGLPDRFPGYTGSPLSFAERFSRLINTDRIVKVRRRGFSGHVFNLQTATGWYVANGILVHNCRCKPVRPFNTQETVLAAWLKAGLGPDAEGAYERSA